MGNGKYVQQCVQKKKKENKRKERKASIHPQGKKGDVLKGNKN